VEEINCLIYAITHLLSAGLSRAHALGIGEGRWHTIAIMIFVLWKC